MQTASTFLKLSSKEVVLDEWQVMDDPGDLQLGDAVSVLAGLIFFILPGLIELWNVLTRPRRFGHVCLTNWRLVYYERGEGWLNNYHYVFAVDLEDIVAVHTDFETGLFDTKSLTVVLYSKFEDTLSIRVGDTGGPMSKLPVIGRLFRRKSLGRDAFVAPPILFARIRHRRGTAVEASSAF